MTELVVDPRAVAAVARPVLEVADRLAAVSSALPAMAGPLGADDLVHALEDAAHVWQPALGELATTLRSASEQLSAAASEYDGVEALVRDWSRP